MKSLSRIFLAVLLVTSQGLTSQAYAATIWAKGFGSVGTDYGAAMAVDRNGNIFVTGVFSNSVDFGGGALTSAGAGSTMFLAKYSSHGSLMWAKQFGGTATWSPKSMALDGSGNIYVAVTGNSGGPLMKLDSSGHLIRAVGPVPLPPVPGI